MRANKPRNRENRTKACPAEEITAIQVKLTRDAYDLTKALERRKVCTKEEIFMAGLEACNRR